MLDCQRLDALRNLHRSAIARMFSRVVHWSWICAGRFLRRRRIWEVAGRFRISALLLVRLHRLGWYGMRALAEQLQRDQVLATRALASLMLNELLEEVRSRVHQAIHDRTGYVELRTRIETGQVELVLVPTDRATTISMSSSTATAILKFSTSHRPIDELPERYQSRR